MRLAENPWFQIFLVLAVVSAGLTVYNQLSKSAYIHTAKQPSDPSAAAPGIESQSANSSNQPSYSQLDSTMPETRRREIANAPSNRILQAPSRPEAPVNTPSAPATAGGGEAQFAEAFKYYSGNGAQQNFSKALLLFGAAADRGSADACQYIGTMYALGRGTPQDYGQAASWFRKGAERDNAASQYSLGVLYSEGNGVSRSDATAFEWWRKAADRGHTKAQVNVGLAYANGNGVGRDDMRALQYWRKAAQVGDPQAQLWVGKFYLQGRAVARDVTEAQYWLRKSASQLGSDSEAQKLLNAISLGNIG